MKEFIPNYTNVLKAVKNSGPDRMPLYEHIISPKIMEEIIGKQFNDLINGDRSDIKEYFRNYIEFFRSMGYDIITFETCIGDVMPGSGALGDHKQGVINNRDDFNKYPWDDIPDQFFNKYKKYYEILEEMMPEGMKAIGGPGNGVFECVQDVIGYEKLCYMSFDDPELYRDMFIKAGEMLNSIWKKFLPGFKDLYVACRFGDDLGYKTSTLISPDDIKKHLIPQYKNIIETIHSHDKPFLFHSCGNIFSVMDDIIDIAGIDAKHSNEDVIAPISTWIDKYSDKICLVGGIDIDFLCRKGDEEIKEYIRDIYQYAIKNARGFIIGSGNSIPDYVPIDKYLLMLEVIREEINTSERTG